jgi:hypothetical protein
VGSLRELAHGLFHNSNPGYPTKRAGFASEFN